MRAERQAKSLERGGAWTVGETCRCVSGGCHLSLHCPHGPRPRTRVSPRVHLCSAASGPTRPPVPLDGASSPPPPSPRPRRGVRSRRTRGGTTRPARTYSPARQVVGGFPPHHPIIAARGAIQVCRGRARSASERAVPPRPHRGGVVTSPATRETHTHAHTLPAPRPFLQRAGLRRALGDSPAPARPRGNGGCPAAAQARGARPLGAREGTAGPRSPAPTSLERQRPGPGRGALAGCARGSGSPPRPSVRPQERRPRQRPQLRLGRAGPAGRGGAGPLSSAAAMWGALRSRVPPGRCARGGAQLRGACRWESGAGVGGRGIRGPPELGQDPPRPGALPYLSQAYPQLPAAATAV